ncbi:hypothetical protein OG203_35065 [Nocardia sp. NBC_01499]|uniref:hypothetical protein n=1 Tax=Nocardia sp. NBC_01499 TaxID=2903597 RepID=UPI00386CE4C2
MGVNDKLDLDPVRVRALANELADAASDVGAIQVQRTHQQVKADMAGSVAAAMCEPAADVAHHAAHLVSQALYEMGINTTAALSTYTGTDERFADQVEAVAEGVR